MGGGMKGWILAGLMLSLALPAHAGRRQVTRVLESVEGHLEEKDYARASEILAKVEADGALNGPRYAVQRSHFFLLRGITQMNLGDAKAAVGDLMRHLDMEQRQHGGVSDKGRLAYVHLGAAHHLAGQHDRSVRAFEASGEQGAALSAALRMWAESHRQRGDLDDALAVLDDGLARHPDDRRLHDQRVSLLLEVGRFDDALASVLAVPGSDEGTAGDLAGWVERFRAAGALEHAQQLLAAGPERSVESPARPTPDAER